MLAAQQKSCSVQLGDLLVHSHLQTFALFGNAALCAKLCTTWTHQELVQLKYIHIKVHKNGNSWTPEVYKSEGSVQEMHKFVHCSIP